MNKHDFRQSIFASIQSISIGKRKEWNMAITTRFLQWPIFQSASTICTYVSTPDEIDTHQLIHHLLNNTKKIIVPKIHGRNLDLYSIQSFDELHKGTYNILEPTQRNNPIDPQSVDLFIIPGLAFDRNGYRLGRGEGYFDRLLAGVTATTVGLSYAVNVVPEVPHEPHDVRIRYIITEQEIIPIHL